MIEKLQEIVDLLRTGIAPDSWGMTQEEWLQHKCNKAAAELQNIIEYMKKEEEE